MIKEKIKLLFRELDFFYQHSSLLCENSARVIPDAAVESRTNESRLFFASVWERVWAVCSACSDWVFSSADADCDDQKASRSKIARNMSFLIDVHPFRKIFFTPLISAKKEEIIPKKKKIAWIGCLLYVYNYIFERKNANK